VLSVTSTYFRSYAMSNSVLDSVLEPNLDSTDDEDVGTEQTRRVRSENPCGTLHYVE
jgi:hypothetical protein